MTEQDIQIRYFKWKDKQALACIMPASFPDYLMPLF